MNDSTDVRIEMHRYAKRRMRDVAEDLEAAQELGDLEELMGEVEEAAQELVSIKSELEEVTA